MPTKTESTARMRLHPICHPTSAAQVVYVQGDRATARLRIECTCCGTLVCEVGILSWMVEPHITPEMVLVQPSEGDEPEVRGILRREDPR
jgi:hypothetical protein